MLESQRGMGSGAGGALPSGALVEHPESSEFNRQGREGKQQLGRNATRSEHLGPNLTKKLGKRHHLIQTEDHSCGPGADFRNRALKNGL